MARKALPATAPVKAGRKALPVVVIETQPAPVPAVPAGHTYPEIKHGSERCSVWLPATVDLADAIAWARYWQPRMETPILLVRHEKDSIRIEHGLVTDAIPERAINQPWHASAAAKLAQEAAKYGHIKTFPLQDVNQVIVPVASEDEALEVIASGELDKPAPVKAPVGRKALAAAPAPPVTGKPLGGDLGAWSAVVVARSPKDIAKAKASAAKPAPAARISKTNGEGGPTKASQVVELLKQKNGCSIADAQAVTEWPCGKAYLARMAIVAKMTLKDLGGKRYKLI